MTAAPTDPPGDPPPPVPALERAPELYRWQLEALASWLRCGRRGVVEAVTGSGKTDVAIAATRDALRRGRSVLVLVPSRVLLEQWHGRLSGALPQARVGRLGDTARDTFATSDVLVATRHSAAAYRPLPGPGGGLLVADECHGLGGATLRRALIGDYAERLGLTATLQRSDDAVTELLLPFFGGVCHRYGFPEAIADGVCARPRVAFVGVPLSQEERADYIATEQQLVGARHHLRTIKGMPLHPFGDFLAAVGHLAERDAGPDGRAARDYLEAFSRRRQIVAQSNAKYELLGRLAPAIAAADGALVFTETVRAANHAINRLDPFVSIDLITGSTARRRRQEILGDLKVRRLDAVAAPRVLDEGIDVPDANLGIVMSASRTRRQMVQRMGRVLRRKRPGVAARFVIMFAQDTLEDPAQHVERDGFLDELEGIADASGVFDLAHGDDLDVFLDQPGPAVVPSPDHLEATAAAVEAAWRDVPAGASPRAIADALAAAVGRDLAHAYLAGARHRVHRTIDGAVLAVFEAELPEPSPDGPYLAFDTGELPVVATPKVEPRKLSTGQAPLELDAVEGGWVLRCTGCGAVSAPARYRWQAFDQTVACRCGVG